MKLRARLAWTTLAAGLPLALALLIGDAWSRQDATERRLTALGQELAEHEHWLARCEARPERWRGGAPRGHRRGPPQECVGPGARDEAGAWSPECKEAKRRKRRRRERWAPKRRSRHPATFFGYDATLKSRHPKAPILDPSLRQALQGKDVFRVSDSWFGDRVKVLLRTQNEEGPCAWLLVQGRVAGGRGGFLPPTHIWILPLVAMFCAVLLSMGPVVRRIRKLTEEVGASKHSNYKSGVEARGDDEISTLARAFDQAANKVRQELHNSRRSEAALREFIANTTHDLMVPLTVLQGNLTELYDAALRQEAARGPKSGSEAGLGRGSDYGAKDASKVLAMQEALRSAMDEAHYIGSLVRNLTISAKLDQTEAVFQPAVIDVNPLVERVIARHRRFAERRQVSLDYALPKDPAMQRADVTLLEQAVGNLVYNAIGHNQAGGHVAVLVESGPEGAMRLRVLDDGPGIAPEALKEVLRRGVRGKEARTRVPEGRGLGLPITQRIVELHGYHLELLPSEFGGLEAVIEIAGAGDREQSGGE